MIKLTQLIQELGINKGVTVKDVVSYYFYNMSPGNDNKWNEYRKICEPYCEKYDIGNYIGLYDFKKLSQQDLNKIYSQMKAIVQKHSQLNELGINNPSIGFKPFRNNKFEQGRNVRETIINFLRANPFQPEIVITKALSDIYHSKIILDNIRKILSMGVIRKQVINPYTKRKIWIYYLSQDKLFELGINKGVTAQEVRDYYLDNFWTDMNFNFNLWQGYIKICQPYLEKYELNGWIGSYNFKQLSQQELNKLYNQMKELIQKHVNINELNINKPIIPIENLRKYLNDNSSKLSHKKFINTFGETFAEYGLNIRMDSIDDLVDVLSDEEIEYLYDDLKFEINKNNANSTI